MNPVLRDIAQHLEFFGYTVRQAEDSEVIAATHDRYWNLVLAWTAGGVLMRAVLARNEAASHARLLELANDLNRKAAVARFYIGDGDGDLILEAWWPRIYEKTTFGTFIDAWHNDCASVATHPGVGDLLG